MGKVTKGSKGKVKKQAEQNKPIKVMPVAITKVKRPYEPIAQKASPKEKVPFAIVTDRGSVVVNDTLESFAIQDKGHGSKGIQDPFVGMYINGLVQPPFNLETLASLQDSNTFHKRCIKTKAQDVAGRGWGLTPSENTTKPSDQEKEIIKALFKRCDLPDTLVSVQDDIETIGCAAIEIGRENDNADGIPEYIGYLPGHTIRVHKCRHKFMQIRGTNFVWFKAFGYEMDVHIKTGEERPIGYFKPADRANEIIWLINKSSKSDYYGVPDAITAMGAIEGIARQRNYNIQFFKNYGIPSYAVYVSGDYNLGTKVDKDGTPDEFGEYPIIREIQAHLSDINTHPHSPLIFAVPSASPDGKVDVEIKPLSVDTKDSSFRMYNSDCRDEIVQAHGVPGYRIGINETGSLGGSTAQESSKIYKGSVIDPKQSTLEKHINKLITTAFKFTGWEFYLNELGLDEETHDVEVATFMFERGAMTPNDIIRYFGERFGIKPVMNLPEMEYHYLAGRAIESKEYLRADTAMAMKGLRDDLRTIITKATKK